MATTNNAGSTPTTPSPNTNKDGSKQRLMAIAAVIIVLLLAVNIFLVIGYNKKGNQNTALTSQLDESEQLKAELEKQYYEALSELEEMRGSNEELNALIESQKEELKSTHDQIDAMLKDSKNLDRARREIRNLTAKVESYVAEINQLRAENEELTTKAAQLTERNDSLASTLATEQREKEELSNVRATLISEKEALEQDKAALSKKVNVASVVKVESVSVTGQKIKKSGKAVNKSYAKNIDQLRVCFKTTANEIVGANVEQFVIRIINPLGETLAIDDLGSGVFQSESTGEQIRFTSIKEFDYDNQANEVCMVWAPNQPFQKGTYDVEVYNKGYLAGTGNFRLK